VFLSFGTYLSPLFSSSVPFPRYGLAVEHAEQDLTVWNGERGRTYFYQSELPYGVTQADYGDKGYAG